MLSLWITRKQYCPQALHSGAHMPDTLCRDSYLSGKNLPAPCFQRCGTSLWTAGIIFYPFIRLTVRFFNTQPHKKRSKNEQRG